MTTYKELLPGCIVKCIHHDSRAEQPSKYGKYGKVIGAYRSSTFSRDCYTVEFFDIAVAENKTRSFHVSYLVAASPLELLALEAEEEVG